MLLEIEMLYVNKNTLCLNMYLCCLTTYYFSHFQLFSYISTKQWAASLDWSRILQHSICQENLLERIIVSPVGEKRERLKNELCNLTSIEFGTLLNDVYQSIDLSLVQDSVSD